MGVCEHCGNDYDKTFDVMRGDERHTFDSFECAIQRMAPRCAHCDLTIIGHGVEQAGTMFCCANCAEAAGVHGLRDRA